VVDFANIILTGQLFLSETGINIHVLCLDGVASIATAGEISSIAASGSVLYKAASKSGSGGNGNSSSNKNIDNNGSGEVPDYVKDNRVPLDRETVLDGKDYKKTDNKVKGAQVYKKGDYYYYRDTFHTGEASHLEVFDKRGKHIGEANPRTGELIPGTVDTTKKINVK